jgi:hypothetical protein
MARFRRVARDYERLPETRAGRHFRAFALLMRSGVIHLALSGAAQALGAYLLRFGLLDPSGEAEGISERGARMGQRSLMPIRLRGSALRTALVAEGNGSRQIWVKPVRQRYSAALRHPVYTPLRPVYSQLLRPSCLPRRQSRATSHHRRPCLFARDQRTRTGLLEERAVPLGKPRKYRLLRFGKASDLPVREDGASRAADRALRLWAGSGGDYQE